MQTAILEGACAGGQVGEGELMLQTDERRDAIQAPVTLRSPSASWSGRGGSFGLLANVSLGRWSFGRDGQSALPCFDLSLRALAPFSLAVAAGTAKFRTPQLHLLSWGTELRSLPGCSYADCSPRRLSVVG